ncbi:hypothetical protein Hanom_Chr12g01172321 [Helianthus anomalus]
MLKSYIHKLVIIISENPKLKAADASPNSPNLTFGTFGHLCPSDSICDIIIIPKF